MATRQMTAVTVTTTPTQLVAANAGRTGLVIRVDPRTQVFFKHDNTASPTTGFPLTSADGIISDGLAPEAALWAVVPSGTGVVRVWETLA